MSKNFEIAAELRADVGKGASRRLRRAGKVPAVLYGADRDPVSLIVDHNFMIHAIEDEAFRSSVLQLVVGDNKRQSVVLRDLQQHPFKPLITHIDFLRVSAGQELRMQVPLHFVNEERSEAARQSGVVVSYQVTEIEIAATPENLPEYLEVDLSGLEPGDSVLVSQIPLPTGVTIPALEVSEDNDWALVSATYIRAGQGTGEMAAAADEAADLAGEVGTLAESADEGASGKDEADGDADNESGARDR